MLPAFKFAWVPNSVQTGVETIYKHPNVYGMDITTSGRDRLIIAPSEEHVRLIIDLIDVMPEPLWILYVLVDPRGGSEKDAGRYQSSDVSRPEAAEFLRRFNDFLEYDGRHNVWVKSAFSPDLLVYDRHNVIYAYGQLREFEAVVAKWGLSRSNHFQVPYPHYHRSNTIFDTDQRAVLRYWNWWQSPLCDEDDD